MERKGTFFAIASDLLDKAHVDDIGCALWLYLWLIHRTTSEEGPVEQRRGLVLYGRPIMPGQVKADLGLPERTYLRHLHRLEAGGYVTLVKEAKGYVITVTNSKKWQWREKQHGTVTSFRRGLGRQYGTNQSRGEVDWEAEARKGSLL